MNDQVDVTRETLFDKPRHVTVHLDGREYLAEVFPPKRPDGYPTVVWLSNDGFDRREFTIGAVLYAVQTGEALYG